MRFIALLALLSPVHALMLSLGFDFVYQIADNTMSTFSCPGLYGVDRINKLPTWPNVTATVFVEEDFSPNCGSCWQLNYEGRHMYLLAVDHAPQGFVASPFTVDWLTAGEGLTNGRVDVFVDPVPLSYCNIGV